MIYAFSFTCNRDLELSELMVKTLTRHCHQLKGLHISNTDIDPETKGYGNGAGWPQGLLKLNALRKIVDKVTDDDYILSVDSDVVFCNPEVFKHVHTYGLIGTKHSVLYKTAMGEWSHMSGALIFIKGDIARKMAELSNDQLDQLRRDFKRFDLTENEDVMLSYFASYCGAAHKDLPKPLSSGDFESNVMNNELKSFYHLNYCPTQFLGVQVDGKWDIAKVLKQKGIEL